jgi:hypothetical protein
VFVTLFMPKGLVGLPEQLRGIKKRFDARRNKTKTEPAAPVSAAAEELAKIE